MKILALLGSPRGKKGNTYRLIESALKGAEDAGAEILFVDITEMDIGYCTGCSTCYSTGSCIQGDDYEDILDLILESDGIILGSPVYINSVTAQLKTLFDRMPDVVHCQMLLGKYGFSVSTAGGGNADIVCDYMNNTLQVMGANTTEDAYAVLAEGDEAFGDACRRSYELGKDLVAAISEKRVYPEQEAFHDRMHERMKNLVLFNKDEWTHEYDYWKEKGWL
ncbi:flavodoxin family protein [Methanolacinia paynteri]|uniref:flavodoxin family protein n=1 Tax=Methanolacinia paynteri TaxID=230356 RepID=UPI00064E450E|nr:flavodoxin family protein [Methanolacinia paynteri]